MGATPSPVINNALSATPNASSVASSGLNTTRANVDSGDNGNNEFMQLLTTLLNNDAATTEASSTQVATTEKGKQEDDKSSSAADVGAQWLLSPFPAQPIPVPNNTVQSGVDVDDVGDVLTPGNNMATNSLLAQNLKRLSNDKIDKSNPAPNQKSTDGSVPDCLLSNQPFQSPLEMMLSKTETIPALLSIDNADKSSNNAASDSPSSSAPSLQAMNSFNAAMNDVNSSAATTQYKIHSRVGSHEWVGEVGNRLTMMMTDKVQSASLQLTPDNLGPVQVKIDVNNNQASVWFTADHPDTRTALEQSLPRLRELFASQGMSLMDAGVFGQSSQQQPSAPFNRDSAPSFGMNDMSNDVTSTQQILRVGLLDTYA